VGGFIASVDCDAVLAGEIEDISGQTAGGRGDCAVIEVANCPPRSPPPPGTA